MVSLIAFICWLYPIKTLGQKTDNPQTEIKTEQVTPPSNEPIPTKAVSSSKVDGVLQNPPVAKSTPATFSGRHYSKAEVEQLIRYYSAQYGIAADLPLRIARCESGLNQFAKNRTSTASGVFQYLSSTWSSTDQGKLGLSVFDADANVKAAVSYIASRGHARPWAASQYCWSK